MVVPIIPFPSLKVKANECSSNPPHKPTDVVIGEESKPVDKVDTRV